jgi:hypothetical protein
MHDRADAGTRESGKSHDCVQIRINGWVSVERGAPKLDRFLLHRDR